MLSWKELETEFRALCNSLWGARVDGQRGVAGEHWSVAGTSDRNAERRFLALAHVAGEKLLSVLTPGTQAAEEVLREGDPVRRWYKAMWKIGRNFEYGPIGEEKTDTGESAGFNYTVTINNIAEASSVFCLELLAEYPQGRRDDMTPIVQAWNALRTLLQSSFSFYDIKEIVGLAGLDLTRIAHLEQKADGGASKGQLMTGIDGVFAEIDEEGRRHFLAIVAEEVLKRRPETRDSLLDYLSRLGWTLAENALIPIELFDPSELAELPSESRGDLIKAAQRLRDGDLSGAISAACGSVDSTTASVYAAERLGDPAAASFQERCKKALAARGVLPKIEKELGELGWDPSDIMPFCKNFEGALNQGAYVMQTLRSRMGDVHGTKPILKPLVFDSLKWAQLLVRALTDN